MSRPVILCFGDSLTAGFGVPSGADYPALLQARLRQRGFPHRVVNAGVSGDTTAGARNRLDWVLRSNPVIAIVTLGANDGLRGLDPGQMHDNLSEIVARLQKSGVQVILGGMKLPPNYGKAFTHRFAAVYPALAQARDVAFIPFFLADVAGRPEFNLDDGIHPNARGYQIVLENIWRILEPLLVNN